MNNEILTMFQTSGQLTLEEVTVNIVMSAVLGFFIFLSYAISHRGTIYSKKFNSSLVILTVLTGTVMTVIGNNIALSLGMVGALSIVRFRTAIKDPMDLIFLFWAISIGIICGGGLYEVAVITSIIVTVCILGLDLLPVAKAPMLLVVNASDVNAEEKVMEIAGKYSRICRVKSRNITGGREDLIIEVRVKEERELVRAISELEGVDYVSLLAHDGEVTF